MSKKPTFRRIAAIKKFTAAGPLFENSLRGCDAVRVVVESADVANQVDIYLKMEGQANWVLITSVTGSDEVVVDSGLFDEIKVECSNFNPINTFSRMVLAGFGTD